MRFCFKWLRNLFRPRYGWRVEYCDIHDDCWFHWGDYWPESYAEQKASYLRMAGYATRITRIDR